MSVLGRVSDQFCQGYLTTVVGSSGPSTAPGSICKVPLTLTSNYREWQGDSLSKESLLVEKVGVALAGKISC